MKSVKVASVCSTGHNFENYAIYATKKFTHVIIYRAITY